MRSNPFRNQTTNEVVIEQHAWIQTETAPAADGFKLLPVPGPRTPALSAARKTNNDPLNTLVDGKLAGSYGPVFPNGEKNGAYKMDLGRVETVTAISSWSHRMGRRGAQRLISNLKRLGYRVGILSGGFTYFAEHLQQKLGVDCISANELDIADGKLTGEVKGEIVDGAKKAELLQKMAREMDITLDQVIAVGDGANDLPMLSLAGLGVAFHAKPVVRQNARHAISTLGLDGILYLLGVRDREIS